MKLINLLVCLTAFLAATLAFAGNESHGGRTWVCDNPDGTKRFEFFDYYYGYTNLNLTINLPDGANEYEIIDKMLARVERLEPTRAKIYRRLSREFTNKAVFTTNSEFTGVEDITLQTGERANCKLVQFLFQHGSADQYKFLVAKDIWDQLDAKMRAASILHEVIYEDSIAQGNPTADPVVVVHAYIASKQIESMNLDQWINTIFTNSIGYYWDSYLFEGLHLYSDGSVQSGTLRKTKIQGINTLDFNSSHLELVGELSRTPDNVIHAKAKGDAVLTVGKEQYFLTVKPWDDTEAYRGHPDADITFKPGAWLLTPVAPHYTNLDDQIFTEEHWFSKASEVTDVLLNISAQESRLIAKRISYSSTKTITTSGKKVKFRPGEWIFYPGGSEVPFPKDGLFSLSDNSRYIKIERSNHQIGFRLCSLEGQTCEQIGAKPFYSKRDLSKHLALSTRKMADIDNIDVPVASGIVLIALGVAQSIPPIGITLGVAGGIVFVSDMVWRTFANTNKNMQKRAERIILKKGYFVTDIPTNRLVSELEASLSQIN